MLLSPVCSSEKLARSCRDKKKKKKARARPYCRLSGRGFLPVALHRLPPASFHARVKGTDERRSAKCATGPISRKQAPPSLQTAFSFPPLPPTTITMATRLVRSSRALPRSLTPSPARALTKVGPSPRIPAMRSMSNVASSSIYAAPAALRMQPPTAQEEASDFKTACDEVQRWFDSPRFKGIKVSPLLRERERGGGNER